LIKKISNKFFQYFSINKLFKNKNDEFFDIYKSYNTDDIIINNLLKYYKLNCFDSIINHNINYNAKSLYIILNKIGHDFQPIYQIIFDNKCKYIITNGNYIFPSNVSGPVYDLKIIDKK
jgi:hypothetical protein